jgi:hypothetical protein
MRQGFRFRIYHENLPHVTALAPMIGHLLCFSELAEAIPVFGVFLRECAMHLSVQSGPEQPNAQIQRSSKAA